MPSIRCRVVRWVTDDPFPGMVEAEIEGADGITIRVVDKAPVFGDLGPDSAYPIELALPIELRSSDDVSALVLLPYGLEDTAGSSVVRVPLHGLAE